MSAMKQVDVISIENRTHFVTNCGGLGNKPHADQKAAETYNMNHD
jgi:hypothetical protein